MWIKGLLSIAVLCLTQFSLNAQSATTVFEMEYNSSKGAKKGAAFVMFSCSENVLSDVWKAWITEKNGKVSMLKGIIGSHEASGVQFDRKTYNSFFDVIKKQADSVTVVSVFQTDAIGFLTPKNEPETWDKYLVSVQELAYESKKACVMDDLKSANEYQAKLNDQLVGLQRDKARAEKSILNSQNGIMNNENNIMTYKRDLLGYESKLVNPRSDKQLSKLLKRKARTQKRMLKAEQNIMDDKANIKENNLKLENNQKEILQKEKELLEQEKVIQAIQLRLEAIKP